jgi:hypothetical protein
LVSDQTQLSETTVNLLSETLIVPPISGRQITGSNNFGGHFYWLYDSHDTCMERVDVGPDLVKCFSLGTLGVLTNNIPRL